MHLCAIGKRGSYHIAGFCNLCFYVNYINYKILKYDTKEKYWNVGLYNIWYLMGIISKILCKLHKLQNPEIWYWGKILKCWTVQYLVPDGDYLKNRQQRIYLFVSSCSPNTMTYNDHPYSLYYVSKFLDFFSPTHPTSA